MYEQIFVCTVWQQQKCAKSLQSVSVSLCAQVCVLKFALYQHKFVCVGTVCVVKSVAFDCHPVINVS